MFNLNTCAAIAGTEVLEFKDEKEMLKAWQRYVIEVDPDIITGYNIVNFDIPYIIERAEALKLPRFAQFSKLRGKESKIKSATFSSKALGTRENKDVNIEGRV